MAEAARQLRYTWRDYRRWPDAERWELIDGEAFAMSPGPNLRHQRILHQLDRQLGDFFEGKPCLVFPAPTDVKLSEQDVVQPDLMVVCDKTLLKDNHIDGPPTLIVEIHSPSTAAFDRTRKLRLYARSGVKEVWLINPYPWLVEVLVLDGASYRLVQAYEKNDTLISVVFPDLKIELQKVFDFEISLEERIEMIKEGHPPYGKASSRTS